MPMIAITNIKHDGVWIDAGSEVSGLPDDVMATLEASGAIAEPVFAQSREEIAAKLRELEIENDTLRAQVVVVNGPGFELGLTQSQMEHAEHGVPPVGEADEPPEETPEEDTQPEG